MARPRPLARGFSSLSSAWRRQGFLQNDRTDASWKRPSFWFDGDNLVGARQFIVYAFSCLNYDKIIIN